MKYPRVLVVCVIAVLSVMPFGVKVGQAEDNHRALVSITFDDATPSQLEIGLPIAKQYGLVGTLYVPTMLIGPEPGKNMGWDKVRVFVDAGWEIGAHSHTHRDLTTLGDQDLLHELTESRNIITEHLGIQPRSFAVPYGEYNDAVLTSIRRTYDNNVAAWGVEEGRTNRIGATDLYTISRFNIRGRHSGALICDALTQAASRREWLVLAFHGIVSYSPPGEYETSIADLDQIFSCIHTLQESGKMQNATVTKAASLINTMSEDGHANVEMKGDITDVNE